MDALPLEMRTDGVGLTAEELALADPTGYSKKYHPGTVSFKDEQASDADLVSILMYPF